MLSHLTVLTIISNSGAGKSTLMNMLTFKNRGSLLIQGEIRVNGVLMDKDKMSNLAAYVQQDDLFIGTMTVREHLVFRVSLKREKNRLRFFLLWVITNAYVFFLLLLLNKTQFVVSRLYSVIFVRSLFKLELLLLPRKEHCPI